MFDWSGKNTDKSGKSQGILIPCVSGNPVLMPSATPQGPVFKYLFSL